MTRDELLKKICPWGTCDCGDDYCRGLTPRYDNKGNLVIESNY